MWEALEWLDWGSRLRSARCATVWVRLQQHYKEQNTPVQIQSLPFTAIKQNGQSPKFRAKGKQSKYIVHLWLLLLSYKKVCGSPHTRQVLAVVTASSKLYNVMNHMWEPIEADTRSV